MTVKKKGDEFKGVVDVDLGLGEGEAQAPAPKGKKPNKPKPAETKKAPRNLREQKKALQAQELDRRIRVTFTVPTSLVGRLRKYARKMQYLEEQDLSQSEVVTQALRAYLDKHDK